MQIVTAVRRHNLNSSEMQGYVAGKVFRWNLQEAIEGTGGRALVIGKGNGWAARDTVKTSEFPIVYMDCYADPDREDGQISQDNGPDKAFAMVGALDDLWHNLRNVWVGAWGSNPGVRVITCYRPEEPRLITHDSQHGHEVPLGDVAKVRTTWHFQIA